MILAQPRVDAVAVEHVTTLWQATNELTGRVAVKTQPTLAPWSKQTAALLHLRHRDAVDHVIRKTGQIDWNGNGVF